MDGNHFDDMIRTAATRGSRRAALRTLAGGLLAALAPAAVSGKRSRGHNGKHKGKNKGNHPNQQPGQPDQQPGQPESCDEQCGGRCVSACPDVMTRNPSTCQCECPAGMTGCGQSCVGQDQCCPGEKPCGGGCIHEASCCPHTERECPNGACVDADACCPGEKSCGGGCIHEDACCPHTHRECGNGACIAKDACCAGTEACPAAPGGCCQPGEACADDGCCPVNATSDVCAGTCTSLDSNDHCGDCLNRCGSCKTCRNINGEYVCAGPDRSAPACEDCIEGQVVPAVSCGDHCCAVGTDCCGGSCCAAGKCQVINGQTCCLKVVDNRQVCLVM